MTISNVTTYQAEVLYTAGANTTNIQSNVTTYQVEVLYTAGANTTNIQSNVTTLQAEALYTTSSNNTINVSTLGVQALVTIPPPALFQAVDVEVLYNSTPNTFFQALYLEVLFLNPINIPPSTMSIRQHTSVRGQLTIGKRN